MGYSRHGSSGAGLSDSASRDRSSNNKRSRRRSTPGQPDKPGEAEAKMRKAGVSESDISRSQRRSDSRSRRQSVSGQPDRPGDAREKMIAAGVMTPEGRHKEITGYYKHPVTGTHKFVAKGEPLPTFRVPEASPKDDYQTTIPGFLPRQYTESHHYPTQQTQDPQKIGYLTGKFMRWDEKISKYIPSREYYEKAGEPFREKFGITAPPKSLKLPAAFVHAAYDYIKRKPVTTTATLATFVAVPPVIKGATVITSKVPIVGAKAAKYGIPAATLGVTALWGGSIAKRVHEQPTGVQKARVAGEIFAGEVFPMGVGAGIGSKLTRSPKAIKQYVDVVIKPTGRTAKPFRYASKDLSFVPKRTGHRVIEPTKKVKTLESAKKFLESQDKTPKVKVDVTPITRPTKQPTFTVKQIRSEPKPYQPQTQPQVQAQMQAQRPSQQKLLIREPKLKPLTRTQQKTTSKISPVIGVHLPETYRQQEKAFQIEKQKQKQRDIQRQKPKPAYFMPHVTRFAIGTSQLPKQFQEEAQKQKPQEKHKPKDVTPTKLLPKTITPIKPEPKSKIKPLKLKSKQKSKKRKKSKSTAKKHQIVNPIATVEQVMSRVI